MALRAILGHGYEIERSTFRDVVFSTSSPEHLVRPKAVAFAREQGGVLQSAREAAAFRVEANGQDSANSYHVTRTVIAYFFRYGMWYGAVDDIADPEQNIILARADEGYAAHSTKNRWVLPKTDNHVRGILERAERNGRMFVVNERSPLELATEQTDGISLFGTYEGIRAILGKDDLPEAYATFLLQNRKRTGRFYNLTSTTLDELGIGDDNAEIRCAGLGDYGNGLVDVGATGRCSDSGWARGVIYR